jgi:hypothetical protein
MFPLNACEQWHFPPSSLEVTCFQGQNIDVPVILEVYCRLYEWQARLSWRIDKARRTENSSCREGRRVSAEVLTVMEIENEFIMSQDGYASIDFTLLDRPNNKYVHFMI